MARDVRVEIDHRAIDELLKHPRLRADLERRGRAMVASLGAGYEAQTWVGRRRTRVTVRTATPAARRAEARRPRLVSALSAGRR